MQKGLVTRDDLLGSDWGRTMLAERDVMTVAKPALMTMAMLIERYCRRPDDPAIRSRLALALMLTGPLIYLGRAWTYTPDEGVWIGPDLAAHRRRPIDEPEAYDTDLATTYGYDLATNVLVPD